MATNGWTDLESRKNRRTSGGNWIDVLLTQLPEEVLWSIMSHMTFKEATRTSVLSHRWRELWRELWACFPGTFNFEAPRIVKKRFSESDEALSNRDTCEFVNWVTRVVDGHLGSTIEEFKVTFDLSNAYHSYVDKWVVFALKKGAKSLVLDLNPSNRTSPKDTMYALPLNCCNLLRSPCKLPNYKPGLKILLLKHIDIPTEVLECFLQSCPLLENLFIDGSTCLTSIRASGLPLALKYLDVCSCPNLKDIEVMAPKLVKFRYRGPCIRLSLQKASLLSEVSIGGATGDPIAYAFDSLSEYFSQLKYLNVVTQLYSQGVAFNDRDLPINLGIPSVPDLTKLKHLKLTVYARPYQTIIGWITLIEARPVLQKLTLELSTCGRWYPLAFESIWEERSDARPLGCLKTLELRGFVGCCTDLEFAIYVIENAVVLEQIRMAHSLYLEAALQKGGSYQLTTLIVDNLASYLFCLIVNFMCCFICLPVLVIVWEINFMFIFFN